MLWVIIEVFKIRCFARRCSDILRQLSQIRLHESFLVIASFHFIYWLRDKKIVEYRCFTPMFQFNIIRHFSLSKISDDSVSAFLSLLKFITIACPRWHQPHQDQKLQFSSSLKFPLFKLQFPCRNSSDAAQMSNFIPLRPRHKNFYHRFITNYYLIV